MKIAVTGAAGKLGSQVCRILTQVGHTVMATDQRFKREMGIHVEVANLLDREGCYRLVEGADVLVHLGNYPHGFNRPPAVIYSENITINANIFQAAHEVGIEKWIFASSIQAMRGTRTVSQNRPSSLAYLPADGHAPHNPSNCYGLSKTAGEALLQYYAANEKRTTIALRYPALLNLDDSPIEKAEFPRPYPYLDELFAYLDFRDAATLIEAIIRAPLSGYHCYMPAAKKNLMRKSPAELIPEFYANVPLRKPIAEVHHLVDMSEIERDTGWTPKYE